MSLDFFQNGILFLISFCQVGHKKQFEGRALLFCFMRERVVVVSARRQSERERFVYVLISL